MFFDQKATAEYWTKFNDAVVKSANAPNKEKIMKYIEQQIILKLQKLREFLILQNMLKISLKEHKA